MRRVGTAVSRSNQIAVIAFSYYLCYNSIIPCLFGHLLRRESTMGSTSSPTINAARALFEKAEYRQALSAFSHVLEADRSNREAFVKSAICQFRLGNPDAIASLRRDLAQSLTPDESALILHHEFIGLVTVRRFNAALKLLTNECPGADIVVIEDIKFAMSSIHKADAPILKQRSERSLQLDLAYNKLMPILENYREDRSQFGSLIMIINDYLLLMIELKHNHRSRNSDTERQCRARIAGTDRHLARSLPRSLRSHGYRRLFRD